MYIMVKKVRKMNKVMKTVFLSAMVVLVISASAIPARAKERIVSYIPQNETMDNVKKDYTGKKLGEVECKAAEELFKRASDCAYCVNELKRNCPDCCIATIPDRAVRCTEKDDEAYNCPPYPFSSKCFVSCEKLYDEDCLKEGCPTTEPDLKYTWGWESKCKSMGDDWICLANNYADELYEEGKSPLPKVDGCKVSWEAKATGDIDDCGSSYDYETEKADKFLCKSYFKSGWGEKKCYIYKPHNDHKECVRRCNQYVEAKAECEKNLDDCYSLQCAQDPSLTLKNCDKSSDGTCAKRIAWPECDLYNAEKCAEFSREAVECINDPAGGQCYACFLEIDKDFSYQFVAKSREAVVLFWQIIADTSGASNAYKYFFTMLKVFDNNTGEIVHNSLVHQKSFKGAFSIFSATSLESGAFKQGHSYSARLYYFIPPDDDEELEATIHNIQIIALRTRE